MIRFVLPGTSESRVPRRRSLLLWLLLFAVAATAYSQDAGQPESERRANWLTDDNIDRLAYLFRRAMADRQLAEAEKLLAACYERCLQDYGADHPDTQSFLDALIETHHIEALSAEKRTLYWSAHDLRMRNVGEALKLLRETMPDPDNLKRLVESTRVNRDQFLATGAGVDPTSVASCEGWLVRYWTLARHWNAARTAGDQRLRRWTHEFGENDAYVMESRLLQASVLMELCSDEAQQQELIRSYLAFVDRYGSKERYVLWKERASTLLAEMHFRAGNRREADRLYAAVRARLPEKSDHELAGWCRSWCDRHDARLLMEKGDYEGADAKISSARLGTIKYGHRNLNKGLTMEGILRMSAEIRRKLGRDKEADEDLAYAQRITDNVAKLNAALQADLEIPGRPIESTPLSPTESPHPNGV